ncbi:Glucuronosyltransferase [Aphelenchoides besseyi]|nr:Glucuronosyltransferase [Aphelenchoides besseyi]
MFLFKVFLLSIFLCMPTNGLKILMYQIGFSKSHFPFSGAIADTLIDSGHSVDKIVIVMNPAVNTNGSTRLRNVYRITRKDEDNPFLRLLHLSDPFKVAVDPRHDSNYIEARKVFCQDLLNNDKLIEKLRSEKYDVYLTAPYDYCGIGLGHILQIPSIHAYTSTQYDEYIPRYFGLPQPASHVSYVFEQEVFPQQFGFFQRLRTIWTALDHWLFDHGIGKEEYAFMAKKYKNFPTPVELFNRITYVFRNTNELITRPRPESAKTKYIGGIAMSKAVTNLTSEFVEVMDETKSKGVILVSFGSLFPTTAIPKSIKLEILKAFAVFPDYNFIWKFNSNDEDRVLLTNYTNVYDFNWVPQIPLLNHRHTKLFLSHFGLNSYLEVSHSGKPIVGVPIFGDQYYNMGCALRNGVAEYVDKTNITTSALIGAISRLLADSSYTRKAMEIAGMLRDRKERPQDVLLNSIEYAAKHPDLAQVLQLESAGMTADRENYLFSFLSIGLPTRSHFQVHRLATEIVYKGTFNLVASLHSCVFKMHVRLVLLLLFSPTCYSLNILMYQIAFSGSHMPFSGAITEKLVDAGHVVDKIIMVFKPDVKNNGSKRLRNVYRIEVNKTDGFHTAPHITDPFNAGPFARRGSVMIDTRKEFCEKLLDNHELIDELKSRSYDVYLLTPFDYCGFALNHLLKIPSVNVFNAIQQAGTLSRQLGLQVMPTQDAFDSRIQGRNREFFQRLRAFLFAADINLDPDTMAVEELRYLRSRIPDLPSTIDMIKTISYVFVNTNEILDIPQPLSNKFKYIAGITLKSTSEKLPDSITKILELPAKGTIVFSFGSLIRTSLIPYELKLELLRAFNEFSDYTFIWKLDEEDDIRSKLENFTNVRAVTWLPQVPLLEDKRTVVFITHGGLNSYIEASIAGKAMISIPFFVDQFYNTDAMVRSGVGIHIDKKNLSYQSMHDALQTILHDSRYTKKASEIASMLRDKKENPGEVLVNTIEYAAKHPSIAEHLQLEAVDMSLIEYYCIDVIVFLLLCTFACLFSVYHIFRFIRRLFRQLKTKTE